MNNQIQWMAHNHVAATLLLLFFAVGGLVFAFNVKQEVFPEISLDRVNITVSYPGASPEEVEEGIILQIEESIAGIDGIKEMRATAAEGIGTVTAVVDTGADVDQVLQDIKNEVDRITTFPEDAEQPVVSKALIRNEVISVVVYGPTTERALRERAEMIRDDLLEMPEITQVELAGVRPYEISIEIEEEMLRRHHLTLEQVAAAVRRASQDTPGGVLKTEGGEILLRTKERRYTGPEHEEIVIRAGADGALLRLGEVATIRDGFEDIDLISRFNGQPAAMVEVYRVGEQRPIEISELVRRYVERQQPAVAGTVIDLALWNDNSEVLQSRFQLLLKNAAIGLLLVLLILSLFLEIKLALWIMLGLPVSFLGALLFLPSFDVSINMMSLFAFIMALGIVVDNSVVVGESIHEHRSRGKERLRAAVEGTREVAVPVVFSVLTTVAAFLPLVYITGTMGKFIRAIPFVVISILMVSLVISLFCLPALLGRRDHASPPGPGLIGRLKGLHRQADALLQRLINGPYRRTLEFCLTYRGLTLAAALALLMLAGGLVGGGLVQFRFMPEVEGDIIRVELEMPQGTLVEETARVEAFIVEQGQRTIAEFDARRDDGSTILRHLYSVIGGTAANEGPGGGGGDSGTHLATTTLFLQPAEKRGLPASEVSARWRELVGEIPGVRSLTFTTNLVRFGDHIDVQLSHHDFTTLLAARDRLQADLANYPGVYDIADNFPEGKRELTLRLKPEARSLGVTEEDLGRQVRSAFFGAEALRLQRGRNEVKVMVRYPEVQRRSLSDLEAMTIRTPDGGDIPLLQAAEVIDGRGYAAISRSDRKRAINVTASVDDRLANAEEVLAALRQGPLARLVADFPGLSYDLEGEEKERRESMGSMGQGFILALFAIYALLAVPLRSFAQPVLIMMAIPFGIVGALLGHLLLGFNLSILSMFGIVALSGVVVNNSLLLIDRINRNRRRQETRVDGPGELDGLAKTAATREAVIDAGCRRFRPILLTSLTTFGGLFPMILETSVQAQFLIPMAISLGFGVLFSTFITLVLVPTLYLVLDGTRLPSQ
ncbi:efflux RND transporter permease subunit [Desulfurivibrio alkaliphilus]|uniref:Acriflavin resistance protein n=1 Tax=Desulfurivibrio alkaliphilus (strain DSM 19089 / UNIQEM U267 / AHT2) TaxID=589865 RepID=D6Z424_DESAT|nr:efflux RND transporter permease subunit [Desulfurivibrio alkaliphilus]ADH86299.1 acriflavin resistance protein [Desulfurivibrio alkaliphilus AHT 2]